MACASCTLVRSLLFSRILSSLLLCLLPISPLHVMSGIGVGYVQAYEVAGSYYKILSIPRSASAGEIKKAYRKLSLQYHPDKNPGDQHSADKFLEVNAAYDCLKQDDCRRAFDGQGLQGVEELKKRKQQHRGNEDLFSHFFGGDNRQQQQQQQRAAEIRLTLTVTLEEIMLGTRKQVGVSFLDACPVCDGSGVDETNAKNQVASRCSRCGGKGVTEQVVQMAPGFAQRIQTPCEQCGGSGKTKGVACRACGTRGTKMKSKTVYVEVPPGWPTGRAIVITGEGNEGPNLLTGNIVVEIQEQAHAVFKRDSTNPADLLANMEISLVDSLLGIHRRPLQLPDGTIAHVSKAAPILPDDTVLLPNKGLPKYGGRGEQRGDAKVVFIVIFPSTLTTAQHAAVQKLL